MLAELHVENIAIIDKANLQFGPGLTVLTGETGAGKSLLIDAIELALGARADNDLVRVGATRAVVSVVFDLSLSSALRSRIEELGVTLEDQSLFIQRELLSEGRSNCRVSGRTIPVSLQKQLGQLLVDLHGQHDHQALLHPERHLGYLDDWIGIDAKDLREQVANQFEALQRLKSHLRSLQTGQREREQRVDMLRFQLEEIGSAEVRVGEMMEMEAQLTRLQNADKIQSLLQVARLKIFDEEQAAEDQLRSALRDLEELSRLDPSFEDSIESLRSAVYQVEEFKFNIRSYAEQVESDPELLETLLDRRELLRKLMKKYGETEADILNYQTEIEQELAQLEGSGISVSELEANIEAAQCELNQVAQTLSAMRKAKSKTFSELVSAELQDLAMEKAQFEIQFEPMPIDATGADKVEFLFSANLGEPVKPLSKIASGGELSRLMLSLKTVLAGKAGVPTLIFDEVDTGLGGRTAAIVARKLEALSRDYQVIVISHVPQIASAEGSHLRIEKSEHNGRVTTQIVPLTEEDRVEEIARMIGGEQIHDSALLHAREMLSRKLI